MNPNGSSGRPQAVTIGLAVLLSGIMVGVAIVGWFMSPASATAHQCQDLEQERTENLQLILVTTGQEQTEAVNRAWAATQLLEEC